MRIVVSGASGLIGSALVPALTGAGHQVVRLVRRAPRSADEMRWTPGDRMDPELLADVDAVINLSGAGVGDRRWTAARRQILEASRVDTTRTLSEALAAAPDRRRVFLSASAVGWYGDTGDRTVDEAAPAGAGFLAGMCERWEAATAAAEQAGVRVVRMRTGLVLSHRGGLLGRIRPLFRLGLGGRIGSGRQYWPWISLADQVAAVRFLLDTDTVSGPVNLTGPTPVTNAEFTRALARAVHRPAVIPVPATALRLVLGAFADEALLAGQRVVPRVLEDAGYRFIHETVAAALDWAVRKQRANQ